MIEKVSKPFILFNSGVLSLKCETVTGQGSKEKEEKQQNVEQNPFNS